MKINREELLNQLISAKDNNFVKIITGIRRCGKSSSGIHALRRAS